MKRDLVNSAKASVAPGIVKGFRFSWLVYGAAAYFGIRYLNRKGILPKQTQAAMNLMNKGVDYAKSQIGLGGESSTSFAGNRSDSSRSSANQSSFNRPSFNDDSSLRH